MSRDMAAIVGDRGQRIRDGLQDAVARLVAVGIVDLLEMVDVAEGDGERPSGRNRRGMSALEQAFEGAAVRQAGQMVDLGRSPGSPCRGSAYRGS